MTVSMARYTYRHLDPDDAREWQELRLEGARDFPLGFLLTSDEVAAADPGWCREVLERQGHRGVFAQEALVGFCGYRPQQLTRIRHRGELGPFFVTQSCQGKGAAQALMAGVIAEARSSGLTQLELFVDTENLHAVAFYERHGFERTAIHLDSVRIEGQPRNDYFYVLRL